MDTTTLILIFGGAVALVLIAWMMLAVFRGRNAGPDVPLWPPTYYYPERPRTPDGPPTGQFRIPSAPTGTPAASKAQAARPSQAELAPDATFAALPVAPRSGVQDDDDTNRKKPPARQDTGTAPTRANPIQPTADPSIEDTAKLPKIPRGIVADDKTNVRTHTVEDDANPRGDADRPPSTRR